MATQDWWARMGHTQHGLEKAYSLYGDIVEPKICNECETGRSMDFGFITLASEQLMKDAIEGTNCQNLDGRNMTANETQSRASPGSGGYGGDGGCSRGRGYGGGSPYSRGGSRYSGGAYGGGRKGGYKRDGGSYGGGGYGGDRGRGYGEGGSGYSRGSGGRRN